MPLRRRSTGAAAQQRARRVMVRSMAGHTGRVLCAFPGQHCGREAVDVDERVNRSQLSDAAVTESLMRPLCRFHHDWKHNYPLEAEALGLYVRGSTYRQENHR